MGALAENLADVTSRIERAARAAGRDPRDVRLLPVTKTHDVAVLEEAYAAGLRLFGENRVQEAVEKAEHFADRPEVGWAMIGHLQSNKARAVAGFATELHTLDSVKLAEKLSHALHDTGRTLDVFVQVNSSAEPQKSGLEPAAVEAFATDLQRYDLVRVRGLMTLALFSDDRGAVEACFEQMATLHDRLADLVGPELSMGMSGDFELAIGYGATTVRVGQALFGARPAP